MARLYFQTAKTSYRAEDSFQVNLFLDTGGKSVNTVSGTVDIPIPSFAVSNVRYGNSIISLWVEQPRTDFAKGYIYFTGGIPGGYGGSSGPILSFTLKAKKVSNPVLRMAEAKVLLNDGQGTELNDLVLSPLTLRIGEALPVPKQEKIQKEKEEAVLAVPPADTVPPEPFLPLVSRHPSVADNKYFVSFSAVDKDTGISYYETREDSLSSVEWQKVTSPYVVQNQFWPAKITIRAYDQAGNFTESSAWAGPSIGFLLVVFSIVFALAIIGAFLFMKKYYRKSIRKKV